MRKILFLLTLFSLNIISAQTWTYKSGGNAFDGKYKTSSVVGKGTNYPYNKPLLVINLFNEESLNFYISDAGYFSDSSGLEVLWVFSNDADTFYESTLTTSEDRETIFFSGFINMISDEHYNNLEFFEKLKSASKVDVRVRNDYGKNDIVFSLSGSTKAIDYIITKKYKDKLNALTAKVESLKKELNELNTKINLKITTLLEEAGVLNDEKEKVLKRIDYYFDLYDLNMNDIDSLYFDITKYSIDLNLFDTDKKLLKELTYIGSHMPNSFEKMKNEIELREQKDTQSSIDKISKLLNRYDFTETEKKVVLDEIKSQSQRYSYLFKRRKANDTLKNPYDLSLIDSISIPIGTILHEVNLLTKKGEKLFNVFGVRLIPDRILDKIEKEIKDFNSNIINELIKKYGLSEEEKKPIISDALITVKVYFEYNISIVNKINIKATHYPDAIILEFIKTDGSIKETSISILRFSRSLFRKIVKKIDKFQN